MTTFKNPTNGYRVKVGTLGPFLGCLFFGFIYFLIRGCIGHAVVSFILAFSTMGLSWMIYPFFAPGIVRKMYLEKGFRQIKRHN